MISTPSLLIITADDFGSTASVSAECDRLVKAAGCGQHVYGGQHYPAGHSVVFRRATLRKGKKPFWVSCSLSAATRAELRAVCSS